MLYAWTVTGTVTASEGGYAWDDPAKKGGVRGLALRTTAEGGRTWIYRYTVDGRKRQITIGKAAGPRAIKIADARKKAREVAANVVHHDDPLADRRTITVGKMLDDFEANHRTRRHHQPPRHDVNVAKQLDRIRDAWGSMRAAAVTHEHVAALLADTRGAIAQNRLRALVRAIWNRARRIGQLAADLANPAEAAPVNRESARSVPALTPDQLGRLLAAAYAYQREVSAPAGAAIALMVFTGCRPREALTLRRGDVDFVARTIRFAERKAGDTMLVPSEPACVLLADLLRTHESDWCFPGRHGRGRLTTIKRAWSWCSEAASLPKGTRLYDVRAGVASTVEAAAGLRAAQQVLGHSDSRTTLRYTRPGDTERRAALRAHVDAIKMAAEVADGLQRDVLAPRRREQRKRKRA